MPVNITVLCVHVVFRLECLPLIVHLALQTVDSSKESPMVSLLLRSNRSKYLFPFLVWTRLKQPPMQILLLFLQISLWPEVILFLV